jgi:hypothetical protein
MMEKASAVMTVQRIYRGGYYGRKTLLQVLRRGIFIGAIINAGLVYEKPGGQDRAAS